MSEYNETTSKKAAEFARTFTGDEFTDPMRGAFRMGRDSAKPSLEILARALEQLAHSVVTVPHDSRTQGYALFDSVTTTAKDAIAEVKARGDWPL